MEITRPNLLSLIENGLKRHKLSLAKLETQAGVPKDTVRDFLRGKTQILRADKLQKIRRVLEPQQIVYVTGLIGKGGEIVPIAEPKQEVPCPPGCESPEVVAARIDGDAMLPAFHGGWIVYYSRMQDLTIPAISGGWQLPYNKADKSAQGAFSEFVGKPCVTGLPDGRIILGVLKHSSTRGRYDIVNYNDSDVKNVRPEWAAKIIFIKTE